MSYNIIILNSITKRNKSVERVCRKVILDKRKRHEEFFIELTETIAKDGYIKENMGNRLSVSKNVNI
jgi:hypothetical protein